MKISAGILLYRKSPGNKIEVLLVHPGGPYFKNKNEGAWTIPKGEIENNEEPLQAALREFKEELSIQLEQKEFIKLDPIIQKGGKKVFAYAAEWKSGWSNFKCNEVTIEFPYKSGKFISFPEIDKAEWFELNTAKKMINSAQIPLILSLSLKEAYPI